MALSVRLDPALEARVEHEAKRLGVTKSECVKDALERILGLKDPAKLPRTVRGKKPMSNPGTSESIAAGIKAKLRAQHSA